MRDTLTKAQMNLVKWALEPMADHWCTDDGAHARGGAVHEEQDLPAIRHGQLFLSKVAEINDDLLYRLEEQLPGMVRANPDAPKADVRRAIEAAAIIRQEMAKHITREADHAT